VTDGDGRAAQRDVCISPPTTSHTKQLLSTGSSAATVAADFTSSLDEAWSTGSPTQPNMLQLSSFQRTVPGLPLPPRSSTDPDHFVDPYHLDLQLRGDDIGAVRNANGTWKLSVPVMDALCVTAAVRDGAMSAHDSAPPDAECRREIACKEASDVGKADTEVLPVPSPSGTPRIYWRAAAINITLFWLLTLHFQFQLAALDIDDGAISGVTAGREMPLLSQPQEALGPSVNGPSLSTIIDTASTPSATSTTIQWTPLLAWNEPRPSCSNNEPSTVAMAVEPAAMATSTAISTTPTLAPRYLPVIELAQTSTPVPPHLTALALNLATCSALPSFTDLVPLTDLPVSATKNGGAAVDAIMNAVSVNAVPTLLPEPGAMPAVPSQVVQGPAAAVHETTHEGGGYLSSEGSTWRVGDHGEGSTWRVGDHGHIIIDGGGHVGSSDHGSCADLLSAEETMPLESEEHTIPQLGLNTVTTSVLLMSMLVHLLARCHRPWFQQHNAGTGTECLRHQLYIRRSNNRNQSP
jgi:hypothetical protein